MPRHISRFGLFETPSRSCADIPVPCTGIIDEKIGVSDELHVAQIFARNPLSVRTAERLMAIARNPVLTKSDNLSLLPHDTPAVAHPKRILYHQAARRSAPSKQDDDRHRSRHIPGTRMRRTLHRERIVDQISFQT
jgi:hypothetical protein